MAFILLGTTRSGTGMLSSALNSHPHIFSDAEIKSIKLINKGVKMEKLGESFHALNGISYEYDYSNKIKYKVWGFSLKYHVLEMLKKCHRFNISKFKVIHIVRRNAFRCAVSHLINKHRKEFNLPPHVYDRVEIPRLTLTEDHVKWFRNRLKEIYATVPKYTELVKNIEGINLYYEELYKSDWLDVSHKVCKYLGIPFYHMFPITYKTGVEQLENSFTNPEMLDFLKEDECILKV